TIQRIAKDEEDQLAQAESAAAGTPTYESTDSALKQRPIYHTDGGRAVRGGGGIVPDLVIRPDTLTTGERAFAKALGAKLPVYRDVLTTYALELKRTRAVENESFKISPEMRREVFQRLRNKGVEVTQADFNAAGQLVDEQLGYEIERYVF